MSDTSTANAEPSRRNGKPASCEPCRKAKVRCDHSRPICGRCRQRGLTSRCWYHPAPLTRERNTPDDQATAAISTGVQPYSRRARRTPSTLPTPDSSEAGHNVNVSSLSSIAEAVPERHAKAVRSLDKLVCPLDQLPLIEELVERLYAISPCVLVPSTILLPAIADLRTRWEAAGDRKTLLRTISNDLYMSAKTPIAVDIRTRPTEFAAQHSGRSLRIEMLGLIYTIAARASLFDLIQLQENKTTFVETMFHCSNKALSWSRKNVPQTTDALIWLAYENAILSTQITGDATLASWRCSSELATDIMALSMHREASYKALPFFLSEIRRRTFAISYNLDKFIAELVGCPPKISKRYVDCQMPLDLLEKDYVTEIPPSADQLARLVTKDGWSIEGKHCNATQSRVRYLLAMAREEVLDFDYRDETSSTVQELRSLSQRIHGMWESLPSHLHYSSECWSTGVSTTRCLMLTTSYLSYRQLDFNIFQQLEKSNASFVAPLLEVCNEIVNTVLQLGACQSRASFLSYDFAYLIIAHGIPSAMRLTAALAGKDYSTSEFPPSISRSSLIRNLSVFVAGLESLHDLGDMDKATAARSAQAISQVLDDVLSPSQPPQSTTGALTPAYVEAIDYAVPGHFHLDLGSTLPSFESPHLGDLDWTNFGSDWIKF